MDPKQKIAGRVVWKVVTILKTRALDCSKCVCALCCRFVTGCIKECIERHVQESSQIDSNTKKEALSCISPDAMHMYESFLQSLPDYAGKGKEIDADTPMPAWMDRSGPSAKLLGHYSGLISLCKYTCYEVVFRSGTANLNYGKIKTPTMMLHARDDPVVGCSVSRHSSHSSALWRCADLCILQTTDWRHACANPHIIGVLFERGGHTGFSKGYFPAGPSHGDDLTLDFFGSLLLEKPCSSQTQ